jgi:hypothetical protein
MPGPDKASATSGDAELEGAAQPLVAARDRLGTLR